jgi:hypothetical protein
MYLAKLNTNLPQVIILYFAKAALQSSAARRVKVVAEAIHPVNEGMKAA